MRVSFGGVWTRSRKQKSFWLWHLLLQSYLHQNLVLQLKIEEKYPIPIYLFLVGTTEPSPLFRHFGISDFLVSC